MPVIVLSVLSDILSVEKYWFVLDVVVLCRGICQIRVAITILIKVDVVLYHTELTMAKMFFGLFNG